MTKQFLFRIVLATTLAFAGIFLSTPAYAQEAFDPPAKKVESGIDLKAVDQKSEGGDELENLFQRDEQEPPLRTAAPDKKQPEVRELKDLENRSEFKDIAVIQRRYLPKTHRWEIYGAPTFVLNDAFFLSYGLNGRLAYYLSERYGIEADVMWLTSTHRSVTDDLAARKVNTTTLLSPTNYFGLDFKWTPIYGKMTWENKKITPFDLYFSAGIGSTGTNQGSSPTLHLGTGQTFALSKGRAVRWDFSWNFFNATSDVVATTAGASKGTQLYNNLFLSVGMSGFFPEATYR